MREQAPVLYWFISLNRIVTSWHQKLVFLLGCFGLVAILTGWPPVLAHSTWTIRILLILFVADYSVRAILEWKKRPSLRAFYFIDLTLKPALKTGIQDIDNLLDASYNGSLPRFILENLSREEITPDYRKALPLMKNALETVWWGYTRPCLKEAILSDEKQTWEKAVASLNDFVIFFLNSAERLLQEFPTADAAVKCSARIDDAFKPIIRVFRDANFEGFLTGTITRSCALL